MAQKFCIYCGAELKSDLKFCPKCGKPLRQVDNNNVLDKEQNQSGDGSLDALLKKIFRIWDIVGASVTFPLWFTAFLLLLIEPYYIELYVDSMEVSFFQSFKVEQALPVSLSVFVMLLIQLITIVTYIVLVISRKSKTGRCVTAAVSLGLALALLLVGFINMNGAGVELVAILECVVLGLFVVGLLVSILKKPEAGVKSEDDE